MANLLQIMDNKGMNLLTALIPKAEVAVLDGGDSLRAAIQKMAHHHYANIPVLSGQGHYLYSIATGDILFYLVENDMTLKEMEQVPLEVVPIHRPLMALSVNASEEEVENAVLNQNYVPFVDERGIFIGIITRRGLFQALSRHEASRE